MTASSPQPILAASGLTKAYGQSRLGGSRTPTLAVNGVDLRIEEGQTVGLVGESGSGKSTIGRMLARLIAPTAGEIRYRGSDWLALQGADLRRSRRKIQVVFQNPYSSLDPKWRVARILAEPFRANTKLGAEEIRAKSAALLESVGLSREALDLYPHQFSGGQRQRICIARAIALDPDILIADEAVSALDVSVQAQILKLLKDIKESRNLSMLFISHDLSVVANLCDEVYVLRNGSVVEKGLTRAVFEAPESDYTRQLIEAIPGRGLD
jgi:ABC-type glutathione transport system ATPase component